MGAHTAIATTLRILTTLALLVAAYICPWWIVVACIVLAMTYYRWYVEGFFVAIVFDALFIAEPTQVIPWISLAVFVSLLISQALRYGE